MRLFCFLLGLLLVFGPLIELLLRDGADADPLRLLQRHSVPQLMQMKVSILFGILLILISAVPHAG